MTWLTGDTTFYFGRLFVGDDGSVVTRRGGGDSMGEDVVMVVTGRMK